MPELPEVETTVRAISKFKNKILKEIVIHNRDLRWQVEHDVEKKTRNKLIKKISRRAKYILIIFDDLYLMIHLGMSGKLRIQNINNNFYKKHDHAELIFDKEKIIFNDTRRFGSIHVTNDFEDHKLIKKLGVEPLSKDFNKDFLFSKCITVAIKKILKRAIKKGGTTLKDFYSADGNEGYFNLKLSVYGRDNEKCKKCKNKIRKINIGQRSTYFCNECQY